MSITIINWTSGGMRPDVVGGEGEAPSEPALALGSHRGSPSRYFQSGPREV